MAITFESNDVNIDDYIIGCGEVPLMGARNKNRTPIIGEFKLEVSELCPSEYRTKDSIIEVAISSATYPQFIGAVVAENRDEQRRSYILTVRSILFFLQEKIVSYENLNTLLVAGLDETSTGNYWTDDYSSTQQNSLTDWPSARVDFVIQTMFDSVLSDKIPSVTFAYDSGFENEELEVIQTPTARSMQMKHLRIDENMLYAINQTFAAGHQVCDNKDNANNRITYFDFISECCSALNCKLEFSTSGTAKVIVMKYITDPVGFTLNPDNVFYKKTKLIEKQEGGYTVDLQFNHATKTSGTTNARSLYTSSSTQHSISSHSEVIGDGKNIVSLYSNMLFLYEIFWDIYGIECFEISNTRYPSQFYSGLQMGENKGRIYVNDYDEFTYETTLEFQTNAKANRVMVKQQRLKVIHDNLL